MSRALYTALLFVMTAIGFGEFRGSLSDRIDTAKNTTIEANRAAGGVKQTIELADRYRHVRSPIAVAGVRG